MNYHHAMCLSKITAVVLLFAGMVVEASAQELATPVAAPQSSSFQASLVDVSNPDQIFFLQEVEKQILFIEKKDEHGDLYFETEIKGVVKEQFSQQTISINNVTVNPKPGGSFLAVVAFDPLSPIIDFTMRAPGNDDRLQSFQVHYSDPKRMESFIKKTSSKSLFLSAGLGYSGVSYTQSATPVGELSGTFLTLRGRSELRFPKSNWMVGISGYFNAVPLSASNAAFPFRFLGLNLRAGTQLGVLRDPWTLSLSFGAYYVTMLTNGTFGFRNVTGPQLYPTLRYQFKSGSSITTYFKYSPVSAGFALLNLNNYEIALGGVFDIAHADDRIGFGVGVDWSQLLLSISDLLGNSSIARSGSFTVSALVSF